MEQKTFVARTGIEKNLTCLMLAATLLLAPVVAPVAARSGADAGSDEEQLRRVQGQIEDAAARSEAYDREVRQLGDETRSLRRRLVGLTARVLEKEAAVEEAEANLAVLEDREIAAQSLFEARSEALVETVAALQILQKNPPPALLVKPDDALEAARASILLAELAPALKEQADALAFKLTELRLIRSAVEDQRTTLMRADRELARERKGLEKSLAKRQKAWAAVSVRADEERQRLAKLAQTASTLEQLLANLNAIVPTFPRQKPDPKQFASRSAETSRTLVPRPKQRGKKGSSGGLATSDGLEIALMSKARGYLRPPALGRVVSAFDRPDGVNGHTKGVQIATQPGAQVIAPFDGEIVFAGPYLSYGQLLIIEAGEGYHLLLSGMSRIDGVVGQRLLAGEPIGLMGQASRPDGDGRDTQKARNAVKPHLYFEMRKNGKPIDPVPWLAQRSQRARG